MTDEPLEAYQAETWEILDPNSATLVAVFYDEEACRAYLAWRNNTPEEEPHDHQD